MIEPHLFPFVLLAVGLINWMLGYFFGVRSRRCIVNGTLFRVDDGRLVGISKDWQIFMNLEQLTVRPDLLPRETKIVETNDRPK